MSPYPIGKPACRWDVLPLQRGFPFLSKIGSLGSVKIEKSGHSFFLTLGISKFDISSQFRIQKGNIYLDHVVFKRKTMEKLAWEKIQFLRFYEAVNWWRITPCLWACILEFSFLILNAKQYSSTSVNTCCAPRRRNRRKPQSPFKTPNVPSD